MRRARANSGWVGVGFGRIRRPDHARFTKPPVCPGKRESRAARGTKSSYVEGNVPLDAARGTKARLYRANVPLADRKRLASPASANPLTAYPAQFARARARPETENWSHPPPQTWIWTLHQLAVKIDSCRNPPRRQK